MLELGNGTEDLEEHPPDGGGGVDALTPEDRRGLNPLTTMSTANSK